MANITGKPIHYNPYRISAWSDVSSTEEVVNLFRDYGKITIGSDIARGDGLFVVKLSEMAGGVPVFIEEVTFSSEVKPFLDMRPRNAFNDKFISGIQLHTLLSTGYNDEIHLFDFASEFDYRTVLCAAETDSLLVIRSYHEAEIAYYKNIPFLFLPAKKHIISRSTLFQEIHTRAIGIRKKERIPLPL